METILPTYFKDFKCIADKCTFSCCVGWNIKVENELVPQYKKMNIKLCSDNCMKMKNDGRCYMLDEQGLCNIIKEHGEELLSYTCQKYPRFARVSNGFAEIALANSCPAVLQILMDTKTPLSYYVEDDFDQVVIASETLAPAASLIKDFLIDILQFNKYPLWTRVFIMYQFVSKNAKNSVEEIQESIEKYYDDAYLTALFDAVLNLEMDIKSALNFKSMFLSSLNYNFTTKHGYKEYIEPIGDISAKYTIDELETLWNEFAIYFEKYSDYLENFMVNSVFRNYGNDNGPDYLINNIEIIMIEFSMVVFTIFMRYLADNKQISDKEVIDISCYYARALEHNMKSASDFVNKLKENDDFSKGLVLFLVRC